MVYRLVNLKLPLIMVTDFIVLALLWLFYYFLHSFLISHTVKSFLRRKLGTKFKYYRLSYNIFSIMGLILILWYGAHISTFNFLPPNKLFTYLGLMLATVGLLAGKRGFRNYDLKEFMGLDLSVNQDQKSGAVLKTKGLARHVRHPLYSAGILILIGFLLFAPTFTNLITFICTMIYLWIGIKLEERKLVKEFGSSYVQYQKQVPMIFPSLGRLFKSLKV
ncbi:MAG: methyltransferase family protein [Candidatus Cyclobacteriaceae bacterium M3_2C_046]